MEYRAINAMYEHCKSILGEGVTIKNVQDELFLIELGRGHIDPVLNSIIKKAIQESNQYGSNEEV